MAKLMIQDSRRMEKLFKTISRHLAENYRKQYDFVHTDYQPHKRTQDTDELRATTDKK